MVLIRNTDFCNKIRERLWYYSGKNDFCNKILYKRAFMVCFKKKMIDFCSKILYKRAFSVLFREK